MKIGTFLVQMNWIRRLFFSFRADSPSTDARRGPDVPECSRHRSFVAHEAHPQLQGLHVSCRFILVARFLSLSLSLSSILFFSLLFSFSNVLQTIHGAPIGFSAETDYSGRRLGSRHIPYCMNESRYGVFRNGAKMATFLMEHARRIATGIRSSRRRGDAELSVTFFFFLYFVAVGKLCRFRVCFLFFIFFVIRVWNRIHLFETNLELVKPPPPT